MNRHSDLPDAGQVPHYTIDANLPDDNEKDALQGSQGTPGAANSYLTEEDAPSTPAASRIVRLDASGDAILPGHVAIASDKGLYLGDPDTDGTWRIIRSGNNLVFERRESGSYVTKDTITP